MSQPDTSLSALVVDDYENVRKRLCEALIKLGVHVKEANNGLEALEMLRTESFQVIFTDIVMPEMDGFELCEEIRNVPDYNDLRIVVVSTHHDTNYIVKALRLGADDYLPKPVEAELLSRVLARVMTPIVLEVHHG